MTTTTTRAAAITLDDKYTQKSGRIYLNGLQAIVRIPMMMHQLDAARGLKTGTFISGYRGSPLGTLDLTIASAAKYVKEHHINFVPGVNEELGATAVWGSQQLNLNKGATYDGVVGMWYGKGPGVDRSADVLKHANAAGTSKHGGVLALAGDDHACKSSTFPHQSEQLFVHTMIPVLNPAGIGDALMLGLHGIAMSRYSGCWTGFKVISDFADSSASVDVDPFALNFKTPTDFDMPIEGLNIRWYDPPVAQEDRLINFKLPAAQAYARANGLDHYAINPREKRLTIVTTGKAYQDTMQALDDLGISHARAESMGIAVYKVALTWPLDPVGMAAVASATPHVLVVEEKRSMIEGQLKAQLFNLPADQRPQVSGKTDVSGAPLLQETLELTATHIARAILRSLKGGSELEEFNHRLSVIERALESKSNPAPVARTPFFCSGCPHNTSTKVPEGSRAMAGIGCHYMATWIVPGTGPFTQMGGEGAPWIGQAPFTDEQHVFANLGDGTYFHSGYLAIRASVAAKVNITYKLLYNDAVAMTGGQHVDGQLTPQIIARQLRAEGVQTIYVVSDDVEKYKDQEAFPSDIKFFHRDKLDEVQRTMRDIKGTSVLIYDQTCAAEKRRRRKRGLMVDPAKRVMINERVCEGCGDCGKKSNCVSIAPVETEFGRKRQIDQSTCNKDYSCLKGFCPSFVTVLGGNLKKPAAATVSDAIESYFASIPTPQMSNLEHPEAIVVTGIGGTGVVTIGAILAMAAHIEGKGATTMDQTGLAQKGGAVTSHIRIAATPDAINTVRIGAAGADAIIGADMLVTTDGDTLSKIRPVDAKVGTTRVFLNTHKAQTGDFTQKPDWRIPVDTVYGRIRNLCGNENLDMLNATHLATRLMGDSIATNMFMLGYAWQKGAVPVGEAAILQAIALNGAAVKMNQNAFLWGRRAAFDLAKVVETAAEKTDPATTDHRRESETLDEVIARRITSLTNYQNARYAKKYSDFVAQVRAREEAVSGKAGVLTDAVARYAYKLMAYKDEYEVARLYTDGAFLNHLKSTFEGDYKLEFNLAPPLLAKRDPKTGHLQKMKMGPWMLHAFRVLAKLRGLRGTPLDVFGYTTERKVERQLITDYFTTISSLLETLGSENLATAVKIAQVPEHIRGYGHVKEEHLAKAKAEEAFLCNAYHNGEPTADIKAAA